MSKYHSIVTRRDFMKGLGLAGAGLGAAAATMPVFHDLDEVIAAGDIKSNPRANLKRPWWVKENDFKDLSTEVDWSLFKVWDWDSESSGTKGLHPRHASWKPEDCTDTVLRQRVEQMLEAKASSRDVHTQIADDRLKAGKPGFALRDYALMSGTHWNGFGRELKDIDFGGKAVTTPEVRGVPKWTGTPEEATNMLRTAGHMFGSPNVGVVEYDADTRKLIYPSKNRFEDVDEPYMDGRIGVIPSKCQWGTSFVVRQPDEYSRRNPSKQQGLYRYANHVMIIIRAQNFIKSLGYTAVGEKAYTAAGMNVPLGIMCGQGELGRLNMQITPEWGSFGGFTPGLPTDLPLAPTKPIDAGIFKFCEACKLCAELCRERTVHSPMSMETEPTWEISGPWNRVGVKKWHLEWPACPSCDGAGTNGINCGSVCPFNTRGKGFASVHEFVKATVANTSIFNGFFTNMSKFMHGAPELPRGEKDFIAYWEQDLNAWPYDTILGGGSGPNGGV